MCADYEIICSCLVIFAKDAGQFMRFQVVNFLWDIIVSPSWNFKATTSTTCPCCCSIVYDCCRLKWIVMTIPHTFGVLVCWPTSFWLAVRHSIRRVRKNYSLWYEKCICGSHRVLGIWFQGQSMLRCEDGRECVIVWSTRMIVKDPTRRMALLDVPKHRIVQHTEGKFLTTVRLLQTQ